MGIFNFRKKLDTVLMAQPEEHRSNMADQYSKVNWTKAFQFSPDISKTETLDFIFWFRQTIGLVAGLAAGMLQLEGMFVIIGFFILLFLVSNMYAYKMLNVNDEDFQNNELMMEGIGNSAGVFFVSWIMCFSF